MSEEMTLEERKVIYRARRGLKKMMSNFDPYVKNYYSEGRAGRKSVVC